MAKYTKYDLGSHRGAQSGNPARPASAESSGSAVSRQVSASESNVSKGGPLVASLYDY